MDEGAHFHRCDFQVHTPRDGRWHGAHPITNEERSAFAVRFIAACREKGLDAVAITDHHDLAFVPYIRQAALNEVDSSGNPIPDKQRIVIFPGMELTLGIPCQAIIIFDAYFPDDMFSLVTECLAIKPNDPAEPQCRAVIRLDRITTFEQLNDELDKHEYLRGHYIVLPNVSQRGDDTILRSGYNGHYRSMPCIGGYLDGGINQLSQGKRNILEGRDVNWGRKRLALFQTSDSRRDDFRDLGRFSTWVKWAEPSAEALRQACLAPQSRILQGTPLVPSIAITSVNVSNSFFMGPIYLELNPQYNAIIGGRGTGKSTILEYIRWSLCDEPSPTLDYEDLPTYEIKRDNLVNQTLTALNANVQVDFVINGVPHSVRRDAANNELTLKIGGGSYEPCTESNVRNLLPIQAYGQKQLSNVGVRLEELARFIRSPVRQHLDDLNLQLDQIAMEIRRLYNQLQQKRRLQREVSNDEREAHSLTERVTTIRSQLTGIGEDERLILSQYDQYVREQEISAKWTQDIENVIEALNNLKQLTSMSYGKITDVESLPNSAILKVMQEQIASLFETLNSAIEQNITKVRRLSNKRNPFFAAEQQLGAKHAEFRKAYELAVQKSSAHELTLSQLRELEERLKAIRERLAANKQALAQIGTPEEQFVNFRDQWCVKHHERSQLLQEQCLRMTDLSNGQIRASLKKGAGVKQITEALISAVSGANIRGAKIESLCQRIAADDDPVRKYQTILDELELLALRDVDDPTSWTLPNTPGLTSSGLTSTDLDRISRRLAPESWLDLLLTPIDDEPVFEYATRESAYISFADASAGQQATALLTALLNEGGVPLIIDQIEEDLDNKVVLNIVEQIWKSKPTRQLIFSSHNANLVVNGDAELVICCDYRVAGEQSGGHIKCQGAIDLEHVRTEITTVMEGGREAFQLRKMKYGF